MGHDNFFSGILDLIKIRTNLPWNKERCALENEALPVLFTSNFLWYVYLPAYFIVFCHICYMDRMLSSYVDLDFHGSVASWDSTKCNKCKWDYRKHEHRPFLMEFSPSLLLISSCCYNNESPSDFWVLAVIMYICMYL